MKKTISRKSSPQDQNFIDITPEANNLWKGIGGHFESFCQILCEFIDNSISNLSANNLPNRLITVSLDDKGDGNVAVSLEDNGTGIKNLTTALKIGDTSNRESQLNEHGFGLKHALAHANPENNNWRIATRTHDDISNGMYKVIESPYTFTQVVKQYSVDNVRWPGKYDDSGTWIYFECKLELYFTLRSGIKGQPGFTKCLDYLCEDLGFIYSGHIKNKKALIRIITPDNRFDKIVVAVEPSWRDGFPKIEDTYQNLGNGNIPIFIQYGLINKSSYEKYYKTNQATSGAEIRFNGRALASGLFTDIWGNKVHNKYNSFLVIVDLRSDDRNLFPKTVTSKTRTRSDDKKTELLYEFIKGMIPKPLSDENASEWNASELVHKLSTIIRARLDNKKSKVEINFNVYYDMEANVTADIYEYDGEVIRIYKATKNKAQIRDVYDLMMYWDGFVADGGKPYKGILVAPDCHKSVKTFLRVVNDMKDRSGNCYNLDITTWRDQGVNYP